MSSPAGSCRVLANLLPTHEALAVSSASQKSAYQKLKAELNRHAHQYYVLDEPVVTDSEYDRLMQQLLHIEQEHPEWVEADSPSQRIGGVVLKEFSQVQHEMPMLSLDNAFSDDELEAFDQRIKDRLKSSAGIEYACEPKLDGIAVSLLYHDAQGNVIGKVNAKGQVVDAKGKVVGGKTTAQVALREAFTFMC